MINHGEESRGREWEGEEEGNKVIKDRGIRMKGRCEEGMKGRSW